MTSIYDGARRVGKTDPNQLLKSGAKYSEKLPQIVLSKSGERISHFISGSCMDSCMDNPSDCFGQAKPEIKLVGEHLLLAFCRSEK
jgi:hypothetical protein